MKQGTPPTAPGNLPAIEGHYVSMPGVGNVSAPHGQFPGFPHGDQLYYVPPQLPQPPPPTYPSTHQTQTHSSPNTVQSVLHQRNTAGHPIYGENEVAEEEHPVAAFCLGVCLGLTINFWALLFLLCWDSVFKTQKDKMRFLWGFCAAIVIEIIFVLVIVFFFVGAVAAAGATEA